MTISNHYPSSPIIMLKPYHHPKAPSPTNVDNFPIEGWMTTMHPTKCIILSQIGKINGYKVYYFKNKPVLCTHTFSVAVISTTIDNNASSPGETKLDHEMEHNCKMLSSQYKSFCYVAHGLDCNT
jgi:hypothetical protein